MHHDTYICEKYILFIRMAFKLYAIHHVTKTVTFQTKIEKKNIVVNPDQLHNWCWALHYSYKRHGMIMMIVWKGICQKNLSKGNDKQVHWHLCYLWGWMN